ncbi:MAG: integrin [Myxococcota bacterium]
MTQTVSESGADDEETTGPAATTGESDTESDGESGTESDGESETDTGTGTSTSGDSGDPEPMCGDAMVDEGEDCDDMGESAQCNDDCTFAVCGDGLVNMAAAEQCDDMGESATCNTDCTNAACGDNVLNTSAGEDCDGIDLAGTTCMDLGFTGGMLACDGGCTLDPSGCSNEAPAAPALALGFSPIKQFDFTWPAVPNADYYQLQQSASFGEPFVPASGDIVGESFSLTVPLHFRHESSYRLLACNQAGCTNGAPVSVIGTLAEAIGYFKASNTEAGDSFGYDVALSDDGNTLAVGALNEDGSAVGINGNEATNSAFNSGAVYVFARDDMGQWSQQAYIKASVPDPDDGFGVSIALNADGNTLAVGAVEEDSDATGIDGDPQSNAAPNSGATYVFVRDDVGQWSQQAYLKAANAGSNDEFGVSVALSADGDTLAVGATGEDSNAIGIDGDATNNSTSNSGATYVFVRDGMGQWSQQAYVKASNTANSDAFGDNVTLSGSGDLLAVAATGEDSNATGIDGDQLNNSASASGAVYVFVRDGMGLWSQQAYVKASNTGSSDTFGSSLALSADASTLAVGATGEDSSVTGINGNGVSNSTSSSGAVYVFVDDGMGIWSQQAYVKASNTGNGDFFGTDVTLSGGGNTLAVGARAEDSNATGINGAQVNSNGTNSGAAYVFEREGMGQWSQQAYVKASDVFLDDFGWAMALSANGETLAIGGRQEQSNATGIGGDSSNNLASASGAVYLY